MHATLLDDYANQLKKLKEQHNYRAIKLIKQDGKYIDNQAYKMLNLASNDYLGLASDEPLRAYFEQYIATGKIDKAWLGNPTNPPIAPSAISVPSLRLGSSSSRLLTGDSQMAHRLEYRLGQLFGRQALLFNSGYHANVGALSALADSSTVILADKWVHASMIDGMRLSQARFYRFRHQDFCQLEQLIDEHHRKADCRRIIVVTESIFSMDGDCTDLVQLVALKHHYPKVMLYVDEAHAVGVRGQGGAGLACELSVRDEIDVLVGAFGKAYASMGGFVVAHPVICEYLINHARTLIFSTALPELMWAWTDFMVACSQLLEYRRTHLQAISRDVIACVQDLGLPCVSQSQIIPVIVKDNDKALIAAQQLQAAGFYVLAVRPPTVPKNQARLRLCLNATLQRDDIAQLTTQLTDLLRDISLRDAGLHDVNGVHQ